MGLLRRSAGVHLVGIGGIGMSGIAEVMLSLGYDVRGSDLKPNNQTRRLEKQGATVFIGHAEENIRDADAVVVSSAVDETNPEVAAAREQLMPVVPRAEMLAELMRFRYSIAVAGTHGKTTTASMLAWILVHAGRDPGFLIGGIPANFGETARFGDSRYFVVEADEYDTAFFDKRAKFVHYRPNTVILNNLEFDHADIYRDLGHVRDAFGRFLAIINSDSLLVHVDDDPNMADETILMEMARMLMGKTGYYLILLGGIFATVSSANASIMAASRINLAMARDHMIPQWLNEIHPKRMTPYRAILLTGVLALLLLAVDNLETLAEIASVLQLYSYAALNIGCVVLRVADPDWYRPSFRVPGTPFLQLFAALGCLAIILLSGLVAQAVILGLIGLSLTFYFTWSRRRVDIESGLGLFRERIAETGWSALVAPAVKYAPAEPVELTPAVRLIDPISPQRVVVALANPQHAADLLRMGRFLATGQNAGGATCNGAQVNQVFNHNRIGEQRVGSQGNDQAN